MWNHPAVPTVLDNGIRSPRKLLAAVMRKLVAALRGRWGTQPTSTDSGN